MREREPVQFLIQGYVAIWRKIPISRIEGNVRCYFFLAWGNRQKYGSNDPGNQYVL